MKRTFAALALAGALALGACSGSAEVPEETFSMEEVAAHAAPGDCWTVVEGIVYDLSGYNTAHPGGAGRIEAMCGIDATEDFSSFHDGSRRAEAILAEHAIGHLEG
ncbi:MAG: cytochrome b5 domain-containing protein [bacterium]|nr:cytochrome b5 domain-containing protein [bacterium]